MISYRYGALHVVENPGDTALIGQLLREIDPRLFIERQVTLEQEQVWCVMCALDGDQPPVCIFEWRDPDGRPIPVISEGIVFRMQQVERDPVALSRKVLESNEQFRKETQRKLSEYLHGEAEERRRSAKSHFVLPRGPGLAAARRRYRREGHNV